MFIETTFSKYDEKRNWIAKLRKHKNTILFEKHLKTLRKSFIFIIIILLAFKNIII